MISQRQLCVDKFCNWSGSNIVSCGGQTSVKSHQDAGSALLVVNGASSRARVMETDGLAMTGQPTSQTLRRAAFAGSPPATSRYH